jgi:uncharacterized protein (TIGR02231 family)
MTFLCLFSIAVFANTVSVPSVLKEATVYRTQARLVHESNYSIPAGSTELVVEDVSNSINPATLQVFIKGGAELVSASYRTNYLNTPGNPLVKKWEDSIEKYNDKIALLNAEKDTYQEEEDLLKSNKSLSNDKTAFTSADVETLASMYRRRALELKQKVLALDKEIKKQSGERDKIQLQISEFNAQANRPRGQIVLTLNSAQATNGAVRCAYNVTSAGWTAQYDLRSEGIGTPVVLIQKADIYQNSGFDWKDVKLTICTGNPSLNNSRPILNPLYVNYVEYRAYGRKSGLLEEEKLSTVNIAMYKAKAPAYNNGDVDKLEFRSSEPLEATLEDNTTNVTYELKLAQTIPGDSKPHTVQFDKQEIPATYIYHTVPRLEPVAFLLARITDWGKYNLVAGNANIFLEGAYEGQSYINPSVTGDTLLLSFGRDERINVKRIKVTDLCESKCIAANRFEKYVYDISIKNTKQQNIEIEVLDQVPVSRQDDIKVELEDIAGAEYLKDFGKLLWTIKLQPSETKKIRFAYTVKYPKSKQVFESN